MTQRKGLEAPHRRLEATPPRIVEQAAVIGYRSMSAVLAFTPPALSRAVIGGANQLAYLAWPAKRRYSNVNFGHVLGPAPGRPAGRPARPARVPRVRPVPGRADAPARRARTRSSPRTSRATAPTAIAGLWRDGGRPVIVVAGHLGNNEAVAAALARRGYPTNVIADDSTFPEIFELLRRQREAWGVHVIPWRNLRELFGVLRRKEILALLVDWGYRSDGIPVRLFGAWTTLPAGPAVLAAKTDAWIAPLADPAHPARQVPRSRRREPFDVAVIRSGRPPARDPADRRLRSRRRSARRRPSGTASSRSGRSTRTRPSSSRRARRPCSPAAPTRARPVAAGPTAAPGS